MGQSGLILPFKVSESFKKEILNFALVDGIDYFKFNGNGKIYCNLNNVECALSEKIKLFSLQCFKELGFTILKEEPNFGNFIGVNSESAFVHMHSDRRVENFWHLRINFMISKPESGGIPIVDYKRYHNIEEDDCWINFASQWKHGSTPVIGKKPRVVLSLGQLVDETQAKELYKKYT
jgi:hypothetical protein